MVQLTILTSVNLLVVKVTLINSDSDSLSPVDVEFTILIEPCTFISPIILIGIEAT